MGILKDKVAIIGEGETEYYYIQSLVDMFRGLKIKPDYPKSTNMTQLGKKIASTIAEGYRYVMCVMDMDTKDNHEEMRKYQALRAKYSQPVVNKKQNIYCEVLFYETHRCTELFFYFYFKYTSRIFQTQDELIKALNNECFYEKKTMFFSKCGGLHSYFERNGGSLESAIHNSNRSLDNRIRTGNDYTYSELGKMLLKLKEIYGQQGI